MRSGFDLTGFTVIARQGFVVTDLKYDIGNHFVKTGGNFIAGRTAILNHVMQNRGTQHIFVCARFAFDDQARNLDRMINIGFISRALAALITMRSGGKIDGFQ